MSERRYLQWSMGTAGPVLAALDNGDDTGWMGFALCAETEPEQFFVEKGGSVKPAKQVCSQCFVRAECLEYALDQDIRHGVWGGLSERERRVITRARRARELAGLGEKTCTGPCGEVKPLGEFYAHPAMPDGHRPDCKVCVRERTAARKQELRREKAA